MTLRSLLERYIDKPPCDYCEEHNLTEANGCGCWKALDQAEAALIELLEREVLPEEQTIPYNPDFAQQPNSARAEGHNQAVAEARQRLYKLKGSDDE